MNIEFKSKKYGLYQLVMDEKTNLNKLRSDMENAEKEIEKYIDYFDLELVCEGEDFWYASVVDGNGIVLSFDGNGDIRVFLDEDGESVGNVKYHWKEFHYEEVREETIVRLKEHIEFLNERAKYFQMCIPEEER